MPERNQPYRAEPLNPRKRVRHLAPTGPNDVPLDGFERLADADPRTGIRPPVGGTLVYPPYHEDM